MFLEKVVGLLFKSDGKGGGGFVEVVECTDPILCEKPWLEFNEDVTIPFATVYGAV